MAQERRDAIVSVIQSCEGIAKLRGGTYIVSNSYQQHPSLNSRRVVRSAHEHEPRHQTQTVVDRFGNRKQIILILDESDDEVQLTNRPPKRTAPINLLEPTLKRLRANASKDETRPNNCNGSAAKDGCLPSAINSQKSLPAPKHSSNLQGKNNSSQSKQSKILSSHCLLASNKQKRPTTLASKPVKPNSGSEQSANPQYLKGIKSPNVLHGLEKSNTQLQAPDTPLVPNIETSKNGLAEVAIHEAQASNKQDQTEIEKHRSNNVSDSSGRMRLSQTISNAVLDQLRQQRETAASSSKQKQPSRTSQSDASPRRCVNATEPTKLTQSQNRVDELLKGRRGVTISSEGLGLDYNENATSETSTEIETISTEQANSLLSLERAKKASTANQTARDVDLALRPEPRNSKPSVLASAESLGNIRQDLNSRNRLGHGRRVLKPHEVTDHDWFLIQWRNEGLEWKEIFGMWRNLTNKMQSSGSIRDRFACMRATFPEAITQPRDRQLAQSQLDTTEVESRNKAVAQKLGNGGKVEDVLRTVRGFKASFNEPADYNGFLDKSKQQTGLSGDNGKVSHPFQGGKKISEDLKNYILATLHDPEDDLDTETETDVEDDDDEDWRANSPVRDEDRIHFIYMVKRRVTPTGTEEEDVEWRVCSDVFTSIKEANEAAMNEVKLNRWHIDVSPINTWTHSICEETGMASFFGTGRNGSIEVIVDRSLRSYYEGVLPENKKGWLSSEIYDATMKTTTETETVDFGEEILEWDEDVVEETELEGGKSTDNQQTIKNAPSTQSLDSTYASGSSTDDGHGTDLDIEALFSDDLLQAIPTSPKDDHPAPKVILRTVTRVCRITRQKTITRSMNVTETPICGVSAVQDQANRIAGDEYLKQLKEVDPDPLSKRPTMKNFEADRKLRKELEASLEQLEEDQTNFDMTIEAEPQETFTNEDNQERVSKTGQTIQIKVVPRVLLNPRNF